MAGTQRFCLTLDLKNDSSLISEYEHWHDSRFIWPEIPAGIREAGILGMEIYRYGTRMFMIIEAGPEFDFQRDMAKLAKAPRQEEWEAFVSKFQQQIPGSAPGEKWMRMERIFKMPE
jgi:L-rhamnose mutarotase